ncbi:MAG: SPOR domain-containing protein [Vicinamibacterales bacterium]
MSDQDFHEIQLSGKQLVFLAMAAVVLAVVIFLLGVSVGKGVRGAMAPATAADMAAPGDTTVPAAPPATTPTATKVTPNDLDYRERLQGQTAANAAKPAETPPSADTTPAAKPNLLSMANPPASEAAAPASKPATPTPTSKPSTPPPATTASSGGSKADASTPPKPAGADAGWVLQVGAFKSKATADDLVKQLKTKGYTAFSITSASLFAVRVGPFAERSEADKVAGRLTKDGYKPLVTR